MTLTKDQQTLILIAGGLFVLSVIVVKQTATAAVNAIANINEGTPFEGGGVVGTLGNVANQASGGVLANVGSAIGEFFSGSFFDRRSVDDLTGT